MGSKDTVLRKFRIFAPSEGSKLLFQFLFLTIIDNIYKVVSRVLLLRKISNPDYSGVVAGMSYLNSKTVKEIRPPNFFFISPFGQLLLSPRFHDISHLHFS